jgi:hypothetical protein
MTTIATIALPAADSWTVSVGGGWIVVMLIGMGLCFVGMFAFMRLMRGGQGWPICGWRRPLERAVHRPNTRSSDVWGHAEDTIRRQRQPRAE